jgi:hypothetical protein
MNTQTPTYTVSLGDGADIPMSGEQIVAAYRAGTIHARTLLWREGMDEWEPLSCVADELGLEVRQQPPPRPAMQVSAAESEPLPDWSRPGLKERLAESQPPPPKAKKGMKVWEWTLLILLGAAFVVHLLHKEHPDRAKSEARERAHGTSESRAIEQAKQLVFSRLKAPSTAQINISGVQRPQWNTINIVGHVDAQNSFGAMIREEFLVGYDEKSDGEWALRYFRLGDKELVGGR